MATGFGEVSDYREVVDAEQVITQLTGFVNALRSKGIPVSPSGLIDAGQATSAIDLLERNQLKEALAATLLSVATQRPVFDSTFDLWFPVALGAKTITDNLVNFLPDGTVDIASVRELLAQLLAGDTESSLNTNEQVAGLMEGNQLTELVALVVDQLGAFESPRGQAFSVYQAMSQVDPQTLIAQVATAMAGGDKTRGSEAQFRRAARSKVDDFKIQVTAETQRRMAEEYGIERVQDYSTPKLPEQLNFLSSFGDDQRKLQLTVQPLARLLAARLAIRRRRAHRGQVDIRKTLRKSMSTGGIPISLSHKKPRPGKPELVVLCDVSGSVAGFSRFTLQLVYALHENFAKVRVFAFVDTVDEVTEYFEHATSAADFTEAIDSMLASARLITRDGHSDYGHAIKGLSQGYEEVLTHRGALLILGDARTNYREPHREALRTLISHTRHAYWLNPEPIAQWDSGDSVASHYGEIIDMFECRNADQLAHVVANLLPI